MCKESDRIGFFGRRNRLFELLQVFLVIVISFYSVKLYGKDKWQEGKKYSEICSPSDSMIYRIYNGFQKDNYYLFRGKKYYSLYPLLNKIEESDQTIPNSLISAYKINQYVSFVFSVIGTISYGAFIASTAWFFVSFDVNGKTAPFIYYSFITMVGSAGVELICTGIESGLANGIRDHYNGYISGFNKNIGLELKYEF